MNAMIIVNPSSYPALWLEITYFDKILRSTEGRRWFELHYHVKELLFNVVQEIQSTIAGFVSIARKQGYKTAITKNIPISNKIFDLAQHQGTELRRNLQSTILTMQAGPYKEEASIVFKYFYPDTGSSDNNSRKRTSPNSNDGSNRNQRPTPHGNGSAPGNDPAGAPPRNNQQSLSHNRPQPNNQLTNPTRQSPQTTTQATPGKTILKLANPDSVHQPIHPGAIFPHPHKPNRFTPMCVRSAYDGKACTYNPCNFYHFPNNLTTLSSELKTKLVTWEAGEPSITWATGAIANWARSR
jgi:hypothetical protein